MKPSFPHLGSEVLTGSPNLISFLQKKINSTEVSKYYEIETTLYSISLT
jgi:hypothetical protein